MKNLLSTCFTILAVMLLFFSTLTAQTNVQTKQYDVLGQATGEILYYNVTMSADSTGDYYSEWYNIANMLGNEVESDLEMTMFFKHSSVLGSSVITSTIVGRFLAGATSDEYQVDSVDATDSVETIQIYKLTLDGYKPQFIRMKFDGLTGNYDDTILSAWLMVIF